MTYKKESAGGCDTTTADTNQHTFIMPSQDMDWLCDLNGLLARFSGMGIGADIAAMSLCELWGLYCFLQRLAEA